MTHPDRDFIANTASDERTLACPLCPHTVDVPPIQPSDSIAAAFGLSGEAMARMHADHLAGVAADALRRHLQTHSVDEWVAEIAGLRRLAEIAQARA